MPLLKFTFGCSFSRPQSYIFNLLHKTSMACSFCFIFYGMRHEKHSGGARRHGADSPRETTVAHGFTFIFQR